MYRSGRPEKKTVPVDVIVDERPALVVGGGRVGLRKTKSLLEAGAAVSLVCPAACDELAALADEGALTWMRRPFEAADTEGKLLAFACTDDKHVNRAVLEAARAAHVPCCCADMNWPDADFTTPAVVRAGGVTLAVSTGGQSCANAKAVKDDLAGWLAARGSSVFAVFGTSDDRLPSRKRAPFHLPPDARTRIAPLLAHVKGVEEFFILNTCNRVEIVARLTDDPAAAALVERVAGFDRLAENEKFVFRGDDAFRHLVRVAAGLESSLLGEYHVVSQFKDALAEAEKNGWMRGALAGYGADVLRVAKDVRHATEGLLKVTEIDRLAVRYLAVHGDLDADTRVAVIGTGTVGRGVVDALAGTDVKLTWVYHRNKPDTPNAVQLAELPAVLKETDVVISAVDAAESVVTPAMADAFTGRNVLLIDLGVPRNVDPFFDDYGRGVTTADLDDLKLWHRVKTGTLNEARARAESVILEALKR